MADELSIGFKRLIDRVYNEHSACSGETYISLSRYKYIMKSVEEMYAELRSLAVLARDVYMPQYPDHTRQNIKNDLRNIEQAIHEFHSSVSLVFRSNIYDHVSYHALEVPVYRQREVTRSVFYGKIVFPRSETIKEFVGTKTVVVVTRHIGRN